ncbi:MAG: phycobilisome linker polypeptide [Thermosynechococcaceae cyanobacterium MS004]|nr:phycobilisome linker polypeptide [Thermosynechococcaceae cyanobacterium MS004]
MLGQSALVRGSASAAENRLFVYEVTGLRQSDLSDQNSFPIRNSGSTFIQVSYRRMNEEMQRITRQGGTIVSIRPAGSHQPQESKSEEPEESLAAAFDA